MHANAELLWILVVHLVLTAAPAVAVTLFAVSRGIRSIPLLLAIALAASGLAAFASFWAYVAHPIVGQAWGYIVLLGSIQLGVWSVYRAELDRRLLAQLSVPLMLWVLGTSFVVFLGFLHGGTESAITMSSTRFSGQLPSDNDIPRYFAEWFSIHGHAGKPPPYPPDWLMSDRPPLQIGYVLSQNAFAETAADLRYQVLCVVVQHLWLVGMWAVLVAAQLRPTTRGLAILAALASDVAILHGFFVWPKLIAAAFLLAALALVISPSWPRLRRDPRVAVVLGCLLALSLLSHGSSIFGIVPLAAVAWMRGLPSLRWVGVAAAVSFVLLGSWSAYQRVEVGGGDRLLKWHLGGQIDVDDRGVVEAIVDGYRDAGLGGTVRNKLDNFGEMAGVTRAPDSVTGVFDSVQAGHFGDAIAEIRTSRFFSLLASLGFFLIAPFAMLLARLRSRGVVMSAEWRFAIVALAFAAIGSLVWGLVQFGTLESRTFLHVSSFAVPLLAICGCVAGLRATYPRLALAIVAANVLFVLLLYVPSLTPPPGSVYSPLAALAVLVSLGGFAVVAFGRDPRPAGVGLPVVLLGLAAAASSAMLLELGAGFTFFQDTWAYFVERPGTSAGDFLRPHNEHIVVIPVAIQKLLLAWFGLGSALPERLVLTAMLAATAVLLFLYVRRRVGGWPALIAAVVLLFLGPAWEVLLWPFEITLVGSMLFGLGALLALDRGDRHGDLAACLLLVAAIGFSSLGVAFAVGAAADVAQRLRSRGLARLYVPAVPLALYALWYLAYGSEASSSLPVHNLVHVPSYLAQSIAASVGSLLGLRTLASGADGAQRPFLGAAALLVLAGLAAYFLRRSPAAARRQLARASAGGIWPPLVAAATFWGLAALNSVPGRTPVASRYMYIGAIFVILIVANLLKGIEIGRRALIVAGAVAALVVGSNLVVLFEGRDWLREQSVLTRANLGAIEVAERTVDPAFWLRPDVAGTGSLVNVGAGPYLELVERHGSPAYTPAELADAPEAGRRQADIVLGQTLPLSTETAVPRTLPPPRASVCATIPPGGGEVRVRTGPTRIDVPPGGRAELSLRRFAEEDHPVKTEGAPGNSTTILEIPPDAAPQPWYLRVEAKQGAAVCRD